MFTLQHLIISIPSSVRCLLCLVGWCQSIRAPHLSHCSRGVWRCRSMENLEREIPKTLRNVLCSWEKNCIPFWERGLGSGALKIKTLSKVFPLSVSRNRKQNISFKGLNPADTMIMFYHNHPPQFHTVQTQTVTYTPAKLIREQIISQSLMPSHWEEFFQWSKLTHWVTGTALITSFHY